MESQTIFSIKDLEKTYNKQRVIHISSLDFKTGQFVALVGKNGSGKSTLMRLLAQQDIYDAGEIFFRSQSLRSCEININPEMAYITEDYILPFLKPLSYWVDVFKTEYSKFDTELFNYLAKKIGINPQKSFHSLSRGQKMKAVFCLLAAKKPSLYILDEITAVLDPSSRWFVIEFLGQEAQKGCLVIMSTNIAEEMQGMATRLVVLDEGSVVFNQNCERFQEEFIKFRAPRKHDQEIQIKFKDLVKIGLNRDDTYSYIGPISKYKDVETTLLNRDLRQITVADVQSYFVARSL